MFQKTKYWTKLEDGRVQCDVCPRDCRLHDGQLGLCFNRAAVNGEIVLTTYGRSSGFCIDPVEKKPLNHFLPGTPIFSLGGIGCNLTCKFCQNWTISKEQDAVLKTLVAEAIASPAVFERLQNPLVSRAEIDAICRASGDWDAGVPPHFDVLADAALPAAIAETAHRLGCKSVAFTYNDPVVFLEYAIDTAVECRKRGLKTVAVTAGYISPGAREDFFAHMDAANVDLKCFTEHFYQRLCSGHLNDVLDTLIYLKHQTDVWFETTTLLIPGENDGDGELDAMTKWVVKELGPDVPMHFSAFHPAWKMQDKPRTPHATLLRARRIAMDNGVRYAYVGNVHDLDAESTYCHNCGVRLIGRDWYVLSDWNLDGHGRC
ncbi:MAG: AmmeMemoRadiSam system radical SAM enzyme, partial [Alphaproteobacteria bacterium]|nr:AmmeMemoRadiSam system radical SAM enzyme [Alphaproteobacteria bacterium]